MEKSPQRKINEMGGIHDTRLWPDENVVNLGDRSRSAANEPRNYPPAFEPASQKEGVVIPGKNQAFVDPTGKMVVETLRRRADSNGLELVPTDEDDRDKDQSNQPSGNRLVRSLEEEAVKPVEEEYVVTEGDLETWREAQQKFQEDPSRDKIIAQLSNEVRELENIFLTSTDSDQRIKVASDIKLKNDNIRQAMEIELSSDLKSLELARFNNNRELISELELKTKVQRDIIDNIKNPGQRIFEKEILKLEAKLGEYKTPGYVHLFMKKNPGENIDSAIEKITLEQARMNGELKAYRTLLQESLEGSDVVNPVSTEEIQALEKEVERIEEVESLEQQLESKSNEITKALKVSRDSRPNDDEFYQAENDRIKSISKQNSEQASEPVVSEVAPQGGKIGGNGFVSKAWSKLKGWFGKK
ncbi:hypothetical protein H6784_05965 [Candidatus Nomurabacteria bacterium]|nr:hypothetical protein [Candidatus Nomurabacteria bacterium]